MLEIPSYDVALLPSLFLPVGLAALVYVVFGIRKIFQGLRSSNIKSISSPINTEEPTAPIAIILAAIAGIAFTALGAFSLIRGTGDVYRFRSVEIPRVVGLRVYRVANECAEPSAVSEFTNQAETQEALRRLQNCTYLFRNHEHFVDGYNMQLMFDDPN